MADGVRLELLTPERWGDLERLFGPKGACGGCWCMHWRVPRGGQLWEEEKGEHNRAVFRSLVESGDAQGILAYQDDEPVGWCAYGPRTDLPRTGSVRALKDTEVEGAWMVHCFLVAAPHRGRGLARSMLEAAVEACRAEGAGCVEGYPVTTAKDGGRLEPIWSYTGPAKIFAEAGFVPVEGTPPHRPLVRLTI